MAILVISGICLTALVSWLGPRLVSELSELLSRIPGYIRALADRPQWTGSAMERQMTELAETIRTRPQELLVAAWPGTVRTARFFGAAVGATTYAILLIILIPIYFFFFCWRFDRIHALQRYIPASRREQILQIVNAMGNVFAAFFRGRLIGAAIMAVLFSVGLWIAAVPYWFLLAIVSALLNIIPYAAFMGWIAVVLIKYLDAVAATQGLGVSFTEVFVWPTVVYLLVQVVDTWLITPLVQARSVNLNPVSVIVVLFIGGTLAGLVGLILAIPVAASIKVLVLELWAPRIRDWSLSH
jgi:predicted PurR-regulated permease PerM